jgi:sulfur relay (sulfurtransferase) DsrC/TusE family protein
MLNKALEVNEKTIQMDHEGYLLEPSDLNKDVAIAIAEKEGIEMTDDAGR